MPPVLEAFGDTIPELTLQSVLVSPSNVSMTLRSTCLHSTATAAHTKPSVRVFAYDLVITCKNHHHHQTIRRSSISKGRHGPTKATERNATNTHSKHVRAERRCRYRRTSIRAISSWARRPKETAHWKTTRLTISDVCDRVCFVSTLEMLSSTITKCKNGLFAVR